jgi:hypothetical protein
MCCLLWSNGPRVGLDQRSAHIASVALEDEREWARYEDLVEMRSDWDGKHKDRFAPRRADIGPADLKVKWTPSAGPLCAAS